MMTGNVTVHWCPSCKSWSRSASGPRLITVDPALRYRLGAVDVDCLQEAHQCANCEVHLLTLRTTSQEHPVFTSITGQDTPSLLSAADCGVLHEVPEVLPAQAAV